MYRFFSLVGDCVLVTGCQNVSSLLPINALLYESHRDIVSRWMKPFGFGELIFMLWLLIMGTKPKPFAAPAA